MAPRPAVSPAHTPAEPGPDQTARECKRQTWLQYRAWSRITSGVLLSVIGAVQYGTSKSSIKSCPTLMLRNYANISIKSWRPSAKPERRRHGRRSQRDPSGAQARRDPRPLPWQVSLPFLTRPLWAPPQSHRRLLAGDEGRHRCRTLLAICMHSTGAHARCLWPIKSVPSSRWREIKVSVNRCLRVGN